MDPKNTTILLVEDAAVMRKIEIKTLKSLGFENIIEAVDGEIAVTKLQGNDKIDLIISDWNMPNKDGYELLVWVRSQDAYKDIPFLMATGQGEKKQEKRPSKPASAVLWPNLSIPMSLSKKLKKPWVFNRKQKMTLRSKRSRRSPNRERYA